MRRFRERDVEREDGRGRRFSARSGPSGGQDRERAERPQEDLRAVRSGHVDPPLPDEVSERDLPFAARAELKTLTRENAEFVARHLAMAAALIERDPALAHRHALSASRRGGRVAVVRETLGITAYTSGDYALALRELRTYRRISGRDDQLALMIDSERGLGRPDRALELGRSADLQALPDAERAQVAIALSGARLDQGKAELALAELEVPQLDPRRAFPYSPALFSAYAEVLAELGRTDEAAAWRQRAEHAARALEDARHDEHETVDVHSEELQGAELEAFYEAYPELRPAPVRQPDPGTDEPEAVTPRDRDERDREAARRLDPEAELEELLAEPGGQAPQAAGAAAAHLLVGPGDEAAAEGDLPVGDEADGAAAVEGASDAEPRMGEPRRAEPQDAEQDGAEQSGAGAEPPGAGAEPPTGSGSGSAQPQASLDPADPAEGGEAAEEGAPEEPEEPTLFEI